MYSNDLASGKQTLPLVRALELPVVLVSGLRLGCISHTLLSAEAIRRDGLELLGWIANLVESDYQFVEQTIETVSRAIEVPLLGRLDWQADLENRKIVEPLKILDNRFWPNNIVEHH